MFLERERTLLPLSPSAFVATQSSRRDLKAYEDALIVSRDGRAARIERFEVGSYWGATWGRKLVSVLTGVRTIQVRFRPVELAIEELKRLTIDYLQIDRERADPNLPLEDVLPLVLERIRAAASSAELFRALALPAVDEVLDVL
jgi:hypothetical protein